MTFDTQVLLDKAVELMLSVGPKMLWALVVFVAGWWAIGRVVSMLERVSEQTDYDEALESFIISISNVGLKVILLVSIAGMLGFETTSLIAVLGAMAFAVGMALQGSLSNFAGGVLILIFKPFRVGDFIESQGYIGTVVSLQIFQTILHTVDNKQIVIPNGALSNGTIINYSATGERRLDLVFGIGYDDDLQKARKLIMDVLQDEPRVFTDEKHVPNIVLGNLGDSAVEIYCQVWVRSKDYLNVKYALNEAVKAVFDKNGIGIPYPQMDVHVHK